jgi:hypothetical protein
VTDDDSLRRTVTKYSVSFNILIKSAIARAIRNTVVDDLIDFCDITMTPTMFAESPRKHTIGYKTNPVSLRIKM